MKYKLSSRHKIYQPNRSYPTIIYVYRQKEKSSPLEILTLENLRLVIWENICQLGDFELAINEFFRLLI